jgi:flagellar motor protein MotB
MLFAKIIPMGKKFHKTEKLFMRKKSLILAFILIMLYAATGFSEPMYIGTTANNYLKILAPAKPAALGEAYVALADDVDSLFYNPAGAGRAMAAEISFTHISWFQQVNYENIDLLLPFSFGNIAISLNGLYLLDPMKNTTAIPAAPYYAINYDFSPFSILGGVSYARGFTDTLFVGASVKVMNYTIDPQAANGSAISFIADFGIIYDMPFLPGLCAGLTFKNIGPPTMFGNMSELQPIDIRAGLGYGGPFLIKDVDLSLEADGEYITDNDINYFLGASVTLFNVITLRGGYKGGTINQPTLGVGVNLARFRLDYAFVPYTEEDLGMTHRVTLSYGFGAPSAKLFFTPAVFSPNRDKYVDYSILNKEVIAPGKVKSYSLTIMNAMGTVIKKYNQLSPSIRMFWNGANNLNRLVPDGEYYASLGINYTNGISADSNRAKVEVDNTPPSVKVDANPKMVKPGALTTLTCPVTFSPSVYDLHGIGRWKLVITTADNRVFKTFSGTGEPLSIVWDGSDDTGLKTVNTGTTYNYTFYAADSVGNWGRSAVSNVKVLLREIVINLASDTLFDIGKADVKISVYKDLQKIADQIKGLGTPNVIVEGHTDNQPLRHGAYADNMELSQYRAKAVVKFFAELFDMNIKMFTPVGKGDTVPVASNDTPEGRQKNRRVTIRIQASKWE